MTGQWWSWSLAAIGITGLWLAGSEHKSGWIVGILVQSLWIVYAVMTRQWGFIASAIAYGAVNTRNLVRWMRRDAKIVGG